MRLLASGLFLAFALSGDVRTCDCSAEKISNRECGLCREAESQAPDVKVFFLKDINPRKPNRWLALPRVHADGGHELADLPAAQRTELWTAAIEKAQSLFGDKWGLAVNGNQSRTQCHAHIHVGRLLDGIETEHYVIVSGPAQIPAPRDGSGLWVHPAGNKLHVHLGEQITETVLLR